LEKKPADRWQSADELLAQLEAVATPSGGMTPTTTRPVPTTRVGKRKRSVPATVVTLAAVASLVLLGGLWLVPKIFGPGSTVAEADFELPRLVVLPFENLGAPEDDYFADGITDEIMSRIGRISGLEVIARSSAMQYKGTEKTASQIAAELDVDYLLEGTVRWSKPAGAASLVRVSPQLIRGTDETQVWAEPFQAELTDVFGLQADVAEMVANALGVSIGSGEAEEIRDRPTENMEAYEHYLHGNSVFYESYGLRDGLADAIEQYEMAVQLDPGFALAYAKLSLAGGARDGSRAERLAKRREFAEEALRLDSELPEGQAALGVYYHDCCRDFANAREHFETALAKRPNDPFLIYLSAGPYRGGGDLERAAALFARASDLDPLRWQMAFRARDSYELLREFDQASFYHERYAATRSVLMRMSPRLITGYYMIKTRIMLKRDGDMDAARESLQEALEQAQEPSNPSYWDLVTRWQKPHGRILCVHEIDACRQGLRNITLVERQLGNVDYYMTMADLYYWVGEHDLSRTYYDSAATAAALERDGALLVERPVAEWVVQNVTHRYAGYASRISAALGDTSAALRYLEQKEDARRTLVDRYLATTFEADAPAAESYLLVGEIDAALEQLEFWLSRPSYLTVPLLRVDPIWDPIRDDPRFQALLERYGN
jgi:TolB-like protein